jgi:ATP-dependent Clp protease ATP-binding subunit ClpB
MREIKLIVSDDAEKLLADEGYDPTYGARPLKRVIQQRIENPLAQRLLSGDFGEGDTIEITAEPAKQTFAFNKTTAKPEMAGAR